MTAEPDRQARQDMFHRLKPEIDSRYPFGRFIALDENGVLADAADFDELLENLNRLGRDPRATLIVQAGEQYPHAAMILLEPSQP